MDWHAALAETLKALAILPRSATARENLSRLYLMKGNLDRALAGAQDVLKDNPASYTSLRTAGRVYEIRGQFAEARQMFNAMVKAGDHGEIDGEGVLADLALATAQYHSAKQHLTAGMDAAEKLGDKIGSAKERVALAEFELATGP